jgi:two-component system chemotaxis response regulator CheY
MVHVHPTILLIDDQVDVRDGMEELLRLEGYTVETAGNGREALTKLYNGLRPCVILMDLMMPVMTGYEFRQEQLRHPEFSGIPIIVYSGITDVRANAHQLEAAAYAGKPIEPDRLMALVRQHCLK